MMTFEIPPNLLASCDCLYITAGTVERGTAEWPLSCHRLSSPDPSLVGFKDDLKITSPRHSNAGFSKFSRFLNSNAASKPDDISIFLGAERRHSWESIANFKVHRPNQFRGHKPAICTVRIVTTFTIRGT
ncbi:hypothetical protein V9T40_014777 [Parthenolecanium corni]|uniref:Uncharacterized protein n=1 Tax=Parthenolecanium corni TaxID=536013 RepID=A0AAN9XY56_9HEMI